LLVGGQGVGTILPPISAGRVLISEFRFRGSRGANDEVVELYNNTDADITVATDDGSNGWALVASDGVARGVIPNFTVLPARGHYLFINRSFCPEINNNCYSLTAHAGGNQRYLGDIANDGGVALFNTSDAANFTHTRRLDAAGFAPADALYREGNGLMPAVEIDAEHSFVRRLNTGLPQDTGDGTADFLLVSTTGAPLGGAPSVLGAPAPENLSSPVQRNSVIDRLTLEQSSIQPNGGGFNSTVSAGTITFNTPLVPNNSINVEFMLGVMQNGNFRFLLNVEALPGQTVAPSASQPNMKTNAARTAGSRMQK
jgi:hypothetical protein